MVCSSLRSLALEQVISTKVGEVFEWERKVFDHVKDKFRACTVIAERQTSIPRARQWLQVVIEVGPSDWSEKAKFVDVSLMYACGGKVEFVRDEAVLMLKQLKGEDNNGYMHSWYCDDVDPDGHRARRGAVRFLLSGSLKKNKDSVLRRSFFRSGLREIHLLPLVASYLVGKVTRPRYNDRLSETENIEREREREEQDEKSNDSTTIRSLLDFAPFLLLSHSSPHRFLTLEIHPLFDNHLVGFLPLLSHLYQFNHLNICNESLATRREINLSFLLEMDTSSLVTFGCFWFCISSLSPLSHCHFPLLQKLVINEGITICGGLSSLDGLTKANTSSLTSLSISSPCLVDISALSLCDLSSLTFLKLKSNALSDLSPLSNFDLSSVKTLHLIDSQISDLSHLGDSDLSSLTDLYLSGSPISDLSPLQSFGPLGRLSLDRTNVADLSPLSLLDLSSLTHLDLSESRISDLSPLSRCDLSSLKEVSFKGTCVSDLSPLTLCVGFAPSELKLSNCPIEDLSPLSLLTFSTGRWRGGTCIFLENTKISDISSLSKIGATSVQVYIRNTPASEALKRRKDITSQYMVGDVTVYWKGMW